MDFSKYPLISRGKVRDLHSCSPTSLIMYSTDRISCYDVSLQTNIPDKGRILTLLTLFWLNYLEVPHHFIKLMAGSVMVVKRLEMVSVEAIVRGYLSGSGWKEYQKFGTVHGIKIRAGMVESEKLDEILFTPSTKAAQGEHDENITYEKLVEIIGAKRADEVKAMALNIYKKASTLAWEKGVIIADTKLEFGVDEEGQLVLADEVLTPDSSRFWPRDQYEKGRAQDSFDKQYVRDYLNSNGLNGKEGVELPPLVVQKTREKYIKVCEMITGSCELL